MEENDKIKQEEIGKTKVDLVGERDVVRKEESTLGNVITDAMLKASGADVAIANGGGIRASIKKGSITLGDAMTAFPFTNFLSTIEVTGKDIIAALEHGVDSYPETAGKFPHVAGMKYVFDPEKPAGQRIVKVTVADKPLDEKATYKLVTNDFMAIGGDDYTMFKGKKIIAEGALLSDVLVDYLKAEGEIDPKIEGRITLGKSEEPVPGFTKIKFKDRYIDGYPGNKFEPVKDISRGEIANIMARVLEAKGDSNGKFSDTKGHWAEKSINALVDAKILSGYKDGTFGPNNKTTRAEFARIVATALNIDSSSNSPKFNDVKGHWAEGYITALADNKLISGYKDGSFKPNGNITRAEVVHIINKIVEKDTTAQIEKVNFIDVNPSYWAFDDIVYASGIRK